MLPAAHTTARGSLAVSAGALEVTMSFKAFKKYSSLTIIYLIAKEVLILSNLLDASVFLLGDEKCYPVKFTA